MSNAVLDAIRKRRVVREMTDEPVTQAQLEQILDAGRWAPTGGNMRQNRFVVVQDEKIKGLIYQVAPGMFQRPPVIILICTDLGVARAHQISDDSLTFPMDVGKAAQNMALAAHSLGLATGPVTSFSQSAVNRILNLPEAFVPHMFICLGHAAEVSQFNVRPWQRITWRDLTFYDRFPSDSGGE
ncbi:MAG: nitroreductase family protein [Anaerolineae bacterium]|nr:nitroreductase family protein [Anaerolineae bacterium]